MSSSHTQYPVKSFSILFGYPVDPDIFFSSNLYMCVCVCVYAIEIGEKAYKWDMELEESNKQMNETESV